MKIENISTVIEELKLFEDPLTKITPNLKKPVKVLD